ncbi:Myb-binding protein 1A [Saguinus oedipus]|uniref:Myb-binding protein 1A n=1 Tax=Saguinus oedipus TaxID=9490 RepID=A0ABQ9VF65_SAGOE|nr:Myb-binding protein 1A [Saguinus oedipus]
MSVLQAGKALGGEESEDEEELGDEAMMALDQNLTSIFAEQKLWIQARQDEKSKAQKEKVPQCDFQIWVLDLVEVLVTKQPENVLVWSCWSHFWASSSAACAAAAPSRSKTCCTRRRASSCGHGSKCTWEFVRLGGLGECRKGKEHPDVRWSDIQLGGQAPPVPWPHYCHDLGDRVEALNGQVAWLVEQAGRQPDSTALYHFNASLYLLQVLKGGTAKGCMHETQEELEAGTDPSPMTKGSQRPSPGLSQLSHLAWAAGCLDLNLTMCVYSSALSSFLTKLHSPLTVPMFLSLFSWHPPLVPNVLRLQAPTITQPQAQACLLLQKTLSLREVRSCFQDPEWKQLIGQVLTKVMVVMEEPVCTLGEAQTKAEHQQALSSLELLNTVFRTCKHEKLTWDLTVLLGVQQGQQQGLQWGAHSTGSSCLLDLYWQAMKTLGVQ